MRKVFLSVIILTGFGAMAQDIRSSEVIIRRDGDKTTKMTIEINGDSVMVNGKPFNETNENGVSIRKRKMIIRGDEGGILDLNGLPEMFSLNDEGGFTNIEKNTDSVAFLGVTTEANNQGALVSSIFESSAAEKAGLKEGDIITKINEDVVTDPASLAKSIQKHHPKEEVTVAYLRNGKSKKTKATLNGKVQVRKNIMVFKGGSEDGKPLILQTPSFGNEEAIEGFPEAGGMRLHLNLPKKQKLGVKTQDTENEKGVKVLDVLPGSPAETGGIKVGDLLTSIADMPVNNTDDVREALHEVEILNNFSIKINRDGKELQLQMKFPKKLNTADF